MILTLTPNTTLDLNVIIPKLVPNTTIRATQTYHSMGGKPTDASWILGRMGVTSHALGLSAGAVGEKIKQMLEEFGTTTDFVKAEGETRINTIIIDKATNEHTTITTASMQVHESHLSALKTKYMEALKSATVLITGGSLPKGMSPEYYVEAIKLAHEQNVPVIFDASQPNLSVGLSAKPTFIKPNQHELSAMLGRDITTIKEAYAVGQDILAQHGIQSIITFGEQGALAVLEHQTYRIPPIDIQVKSPAGAGDAVLAGLAHAIHHENPIEDGLRLGIATATAVCLHMGTAAYEIADMERFLPQVELILYP